MKKRLLKFLALSIAYAWFGRDGAHAQSQTLAPDCKLPFTFSAAAAPGRAPTAGYDNRTIQCNTWVLSFQAPTTVTVISLRLESASDTAGAAATWGAFSGTTVTGSNPLTTLQYSTFIGQGNPAWLSVRLTSATGTGTITGTLYGWYTPPQVYTSGTSGGPTANVNVAQYGGTNVALGQAAMAASMPVAIASNQSNVAMNLAAVAGTTAVTGGLAGSQGVGGLAAAGAAITGNPLLGGGSDGTNARALHVDTQGNQTQYLGCTSQAAVALSGTSYTEIVAGTASQIIKVCKIFVTSAAAGVPNVNTFSIARATVTTCGSPTVLLAPTAVTGFDLDFGGALQSGTAQSICISESTGNSDVVTITYQKAAF